MKVIKILGVVFGALFLLTGIGMLVGAEVFERGSGRFDQGLAEQGLAGPVEGRVTAIDDIQGTQVYTVEYTDKDGTSRTGQGVVAQGTTAPADGAEVQVYYSTSDPSVIIILDFAGGNFERVAGLLRTAGIVFLAVGAVLLLAGIVGLAMSSRRRAPALAAAPAEAPTAATTAPPPQDPPGPELDPTPTQPFPAATPNDPTPPPDTNRPGG